MWGFKGFLLPCFSFNGWISRSNHNRPLNAAEPTAGMGMELDAVTAVVMGGSLMRGGKANISGTFIACLLLGVIKMAW